MSKNTERAHARVHRSSEALDRLIGQLVRDGMLDPRQADRVLQVLTRLNESWAEYAHAVAVEVR